MGEEMANLYKGRRSDLPKRDGLSPEQRGAFRQIRRGAERAGSFLSSGGKGGLDPRLVLKVMRRDGFRCKSCGELGSKENGGLGVHHKGGIAASAWLSRQGHANKSSNLVSICGNCHDSEHEQARREGNDSSQVTPEGDEGTKRDRGLPLAKPES